MPAVPVLAAIGGGSAIAGGLTVASTGAGIYAATQAGKNKAPPAPTPVDPGQVAIDYTKSMANPELQQELLDAEKEFRPQYNDLNLKDLRQYLLGSEGTPGALDLFNQSSLSAANTQAGANTIQRTADIADVNNLGLKATEAFRNANPELKAQIAKAQGLSGGDPYTQFRGAVTAGQPNFGDLQFTNAQASLLGQAPQASAQGYTAANVRPTGAVGGGLLGQSLYGQALGANGLGQVGSTLQGRAQQFAQSTGQLNPDELRALQQSVREASTARGVDMSSSGITAEALARLTNERQRMQEDLGLASSLNAQNQAELGANRGFQQSVQGQELGRQFQNQSVDAQQAALNQAAQNQAGQFGASAANQNSQFNTALLGQYGLSNQAAQNQFNLYNSQADLATQEANRGFSANQYQQNLSNLGLLGQMEAQQLGADRGYALQLAQMQASIASDPFQAILGRSSGALQYGAGQQGFAGNLTQQSQGPQLFNPDAGINLALANNANQGSYNAATYGANAARSGAVLSGLFSNLGSLGGGYFGRKGG